LDFLPTIWFRNTWSWGRDDRKPILRQGAPAMIEASHDVLGPYQLHCENADALLFTENESNLERLWGVPNRSPFVKDSINDAVTQNKIEHVNPEKVGTKAAAHYRFLIAPAESVSIRLRLRKIDDHLLPGDSVVSVSPTHSSALTGASRPSLAPGERVRATRLFDDFDEIFGRRQNEANEFYDSISPANLASEHKAIQRQALAGLLWTKQF